MRDKSPIIQCRSEICFNEIYKPQISLHLRNIMFSFFSLLIFTQQALPNLLLSVLRGQKKKKKKNKSRVLKGLMLTPAKKKFLNNILVFGILCNQITKTLTYFLWIEIKVIENGWQKPWKPLICLRPAWIKNVKKVGSAPYCECSGRLLKPPCQCSIIDFLFIHGVWFININIDL